MSNYIQYFNERWFIEPTHQQIPRKLVFNNEFMKPQHFLCINYVHLICTLFHARRQFFMETLLTEDENVYVMSVCSFQVCTFS